MSKVLTKKIEKVELIKVEKVFNNPAMKQKYVYNFYFEGIDNPLIVENINEPIKEELSGRKIKYKLNSDNEVIDFDVI